MLLIGYGNPARGDDGLGQALAARIEGRLPGVEVRVDYQLTVDHALDLGHTDLVIFADAMTESAEPVRFAPVSASKTANLTSHSLTPPELLGLTQILFDAVPEAYVLGIAGTAFGTVKEGLSRTAQRNLDAAEALLCDWWSDRAELAHA